MSGYSTDNVLASVWNDSGSERSSSDSEFEPGKGTIQCTIYLKIVKTQKCIGLYSLEK